jgi:alkylation response protein AidB-like acyl-CoA dehydrogenase
VQHPAPYRHAHASFAVVAEDMIEEAVMNWEIVRSPVAFLKHSLPVVHDEESLSDYEAWWNAGGASISDAVDRAGTPWLRMFDKSGARVDELLFPPKYRDMLQEGYRRGVLWRAFAEGSLSAAYRLVYVSSFYDPGLACPYTVSLATAAALEKYGDAEVKQHFLSNLLRREHDIWQGATWMTEIKGGSDLGHSVETIARPTAGGWQLSGDKYFASNVGAEVALVAARVEGAPANVRGLALFAVPRHRANGELNYFIRRMKDKIATRSVPTGEVELRESEAWLLGEANLGIYIILEVLNISRVANSVGSVALIQRALADALQFAQHRTAFGKPIIEHPLLRRQFAERWHGLNTAAALAWEAARLLDQVWQERPPYSDRYHLFRLIAHLAKYWTAEFAAQTAKWAMEVHGGLGVLQEFGADRWLREAMILAIWEGTSHRQILDGLEVMERHKAHRLLLQHVSAAIPHSVSEEMLSRIERYLALPVEEKEAGAEPLFHDLALLTGEALLHERLGAHETAAVPA